MRHVVVDVHAQHAEKSLVTSKTLDHRVALAVKVAHFGAYLVKVLTIADSRLNW